MRNKLYGLFAVFAFLISSPVLAGPVTCYLEATTGVSSTKLAVPSGSTSLDGLSSTGWLYAPGGGCDIRMDKMLVGLMGRYDLGHMTTNIELSGNSAAPRIDNPWLFAGRIGYEVNPTTVIYGLAGFSGAKLDLTSINPSLDKRTMKGKTIGGGVEWVISGPWSGKAEYSYTAFDKTTFGMVDLTPVTHAVRVGATYRFVGGGFFDDAKETLAPPMK